MKVIATALLLFGRSDAFYVPGVAPQTFQNGDVVDMKVNSLTSVHTQIPKDFYRLPFCIPENGPKMASENLGEFLTGNKIQSSPYSINMLTDVKCSKVCQVDLKQKEAAKLRLHIKYGYHHNWIIDNLPSANVGVSNGKVQKHYAGGFPIGFVAKDGKDAFVYNHANIILDYHERDGGYRVVGFSVEPLSIKHVFQGGYEWDGVSKEGMGRPLATCLDDKHLNRDEISAFQLVAPNEKIIYSYDVTWKKSDVAWTSRWDVYLSEDHLIPAQVHWYSIANSIFVVIFLSLLVISVLLRNVKRDIDGYNALSVLADEEDGEEPEETGWKLVHADVFRPPDNFPIVYCVFVGS